MIQFGPLSSHPLRRSLLFIATTIVFLAIARPGGENAQAETQPSSNHRSVYAAPSQTGPVDSTALGSAWAVDTWAESKLVITEIHHSPDNFDREFEFVEIYNDGEDAVNLNGWAIDGAVYFIFTDNVVVKPGEYAVIAENPAAVRQFWKVDAHGPYSGRLDGDGEELILRKPSALIADSVDYRLGFPWPTVGDSPSQSINLLYPTLENSRAGNWRSATPSPGDPSQVANINPPPHIELVDHSPQQPKTGQPVEVTATVADADGVTSVLLEYQVVEPGEYVAIIDPAYQEGWTSVPMVDTGSQNEVGALYTATIPAGTQQHRRLIRYRIRAVDGATHSITVPYADDPQPNFAYFVYDGMPEWRGAIKPRRPGTEAGTLRSHDFDSMREMAVYHLITREEDYRDGLIESGYEGSEYLWHGALVYDGKVYDHIRYRARGGTWRYSLGKNHPKIDFNRGHDFQAYDDYGQPYAIKWRKLNLGSTIQQGERLHRGEHGMFESVGFRLFNLAGVPAPKTHFVHFRTVMREDEEPSDYAGDLQYDTDFMGLYLAIEQMDGRFLDEHNLPDGNLYKMEAGFGELNNQGADAVADLSDLREFLNTYRAGDLTEEWWQANVDLDGFYSYRAIVEAIHHYDINKQKNYFYFNNPEKDIWQVLPWDIDQTWADNMFGTGYEELLRANILRHPAIDIAHQNRQREILDLLFNAEQTGLLLDEHAALINQSSDGLTMVNADRAMWDYNPLMTGANVDVRKAGQGRFYESSPTFDFPGMVGLMKQWVVTRGKWIEDELITDQEDIPSTSTALYVGKAGYPADDLRFGHAGYNDPQGADSIIAMQWRIAPIHYPGVAGYDPTIRNRYEIEATWTSELFSPDEKEIAIPQGACLPGQTCRVRVRMQDSTGYWGHWSAPLEFVAGEPLLPAVNTLIPTEIMFNAGSSGPIPGHELDFIELKNVSDLPIDLSAMSFSDGIEFTFPNNTVLAPRSFLLLTEDSERFEFIYGLTPFGQYSGRLADNGEPLRLDDAFGRSVFALAYGTEPPWPVLANGQGFAAVLTEPGSAETDVQDPNMWRASTNIGGSPGADDPINIVINEVLANPLSGTSGVIELWNSTKHRGSIGGWYLTTNRSQPRQYRIPIRTVLEPEEYWTVEDATFNLTTDNLAGLTLDPAGGVLTLLSANELGRLTGYEHSFAYAAAAPGISTGRLINPMGEEDFVLQEVMTLGAENGSAIIGPLVISKLNFRPNVGQEFVEITNVSSEEVVLSDPQAPDSRWSVGGIYYQFPLGLSIAPNDRILLVPSEPRDFCMSESYLHIASSIADSKLTTTPGSVRVLGPFAGGLQDNSGTVTLSRPAVLTPGAAPAQMPVERVTYSVSPPWPSIGFGAEDFMLARKNSGYGNDPANWQKEAVVRAKSSPYPLSICRFDVTVNETARETTIEWSTLAESTIAGYHLWQYDVASNQDPARLTEEPIPVNASTLGVTPLATQRVSEYSYTVAQVEGPLPSAATTYYKVEAVDTDGQIIATTYTSPLNELQVVYLPVTQ